MKKHKYTISAVIVCFLFFSLAFLSVEGFHWKNLKYTGSAITSDELSHIPAGYYYLRTGRYFINPEHPPLVKDIAALPLLFLNPILPEISDKISLPSEFTKEKYPPESFVLPQYLELDNSQWDWGRIFLFNPQNNPDTIAFWSRFSVIAFNAIFLFLLYFFISRNWSKRTALAGIFLIAFSQFSLAHGSLVTMDFMAAVLQLIAFACFAAYLRKYVMEEKARGWFFLSVLFFTLALLVKFSSIIILPAAFLAAIVYIFWRKRSWSGVGKFILRFILFGVCLLLAIALFYSLHTRNMDNDRMIIQIIQNYPGEFPAIGSEILSSFVVNNPVTKGLADYFSGIMMVYGRMEGAAQTIYFMGGIYGPEGAGPLYFPILYLTKLSVGFLFLNLLALLLAIINFIFFKEPLKSLIDKHLKNPLGILLIAFAYLYMVVALSSTFQIGLRHIMPVILIAAILTARVIDTYWDKNIFRTLRIKHIFFVTGVFMIVSTISSFPYYLSYYNFFGGGTDKGYQIATDSNYDWGGQDVKLFSKWVKDNNIQKVYTDIFTNVPLAYYLGDAFENYNIEWRGLPAPGSYVAVSAFEYQNNVYNNKVKSDRKYSTLKDNLVARVGTTIFVFKVPEK